MRDPYEVLGIPSGAPEEQVKAAYRELSAKYRENGYENGALSDIARSRLEELDAAYDQIMMHSSGGFTDFGQSGYYSYSDLSDIRSMIVEGRAEDAELLLDGIPEAARTAEWYYLKGSVLQRRGWLDEAAANFEKANRMEPSNPTYGAAYKNVRRASSGGYRTERRQGKSGCGTCDLCSGLLCADCCCECMGGDLIPCC